MVPLYFIVTIRRASAKRMYQVVNSLCFSCIWFKRHSPGVLYCNIETQDLLPEKQRNEQLKENILRILKVKSHIIKYNNKYFIMSNPAENLKKNIEAWFYHLTAQGIAPNEAAGRAINLVKEYMIDQLIWTPMTLLLKEFFWKLSTL